VSACRTEDQAESGRPCHYTVGGVNSKEVIEFFRILRLAVVRLPAGSNTPSSSSLVSAHRLLPVVYRSFAPHLLPVPVDSDDAAGGRGGSTRRRRRPETMKETFARVIIELINTGIISYYYQRQPLFLHNPTAIPSVCLSRGCTV